MQIRRSKVTGSINLSGLSALELKILKLDLLNSWIGSIGVISKSKVFSDGEGKLRYYTNKDIMRGIRSLINKRLVESR